MLKVDRRPRKRERLEARVTANQKRLIERAAQLRETSVTDFLVGTALQAASGTIRDFEMLELRDEARAVVQRIDDCRFPIDDWKTGPSTIVADLLKGWRGLTTHPFQSATGNRQFLMR